MISKKNKVKKHIDLTCARRKSGKIMTLKTRDLKDIGKDHEDPLVIPEEDTTFDDIGSKNKSKSWIDICKSLTQ